MNNVLVVLLAGGVGSRLNILASERAKPAAPFGGIYRIIDFTLSNVMNSGFPYVAVLTQYKPLSLMGHIGTGSAWDFIGRTRGVEILPPRTGDKDSDWYKGTADAVRQNISYIEDKNPEYVLLLSGDHIYYMNYLELIDYHIQKDARVTIGMREVPFEMISFFGIARIDDDRKITEWMEKPAVSDSNLASMGVYVFDADYLLEMLTLNPGNDFGHQLVPQIVDSGNAYAYLFNGYWKDVGTLETYWETNMDLLSPDSGLKPEEWGIRANLEESGRTGDRPPSWISERAKVENVCMAPGCVIRGTTENCILSPGVEIDAGATVKDSIIMHDSYIGKNCRVERAIIDKNVEITDGCIIGRPESPDHPNKDFPQHLYNGLNLIGKGSVFPKDTILGKNCIVYPKVLPDHFPGKVIPSGSVIYPYNRER